MEMKIFFFFNVLKNQDDELELVNQSSYFYEAHNNQTKRLRNYAATKGIRTRNRPPHPAVIQRDLLTPKTTKTPHSITISDDDNDDDNDDYNNEKDFNKPTTSHNKQKRKPRTTKSEHDSEKPKRKTSQNQSVQTEDESEEKTAATTSQKEDPENQLI